MNISKKGLDLIKSFEGYANKSYQDTGGVWTIGWGTIKYPDGIKVKAGNTCTLDEAETWLKNDVQGAADTINHLHWAVPLNQPQFDALVSFQYNTKGKGSISASYHGSQYIRSKMLDFRLKPQRQSQRKSL